jgi:hypothetical protein
MSENQLLSQLRTEKPVMIMNLHRSAKMSHKSILHNMSSVANFVWTFRDGAATIRFT